MSEEQTMYALAIFIGSSGGAACWLGRNTMAVWIVGLVWLLGGVIVAGSAFGRYRDVRMLTKAPSAHANKRPTWAQRHPQPQAGHSPILSKLRNAEPTGRTMFKPAPDIGPKMTAYGWLNRDKDKPRATIQNFGGVEPDFLMTEAQFDRLRPHLVIAVPKTQPPA